MGADIPVSLALIAEEAPPAHRGKLVAFSQVLWLVGVVASIVISFIVSAAGPLGGRILFGHILLVAIIVWMLRRRLPESEQWNTAVDAADHADRGSTHVHHNHVRDLIPYISALAATALFYTFNNLSANTMGQFTTYLFVNAVGTSVTVATAIALVGLPLGLLANFIFMRIVDRPPVRRAGFVVGTLLLVVGFCIPLLLGFNLVTLMITTFFSAFGGGLAGEAIYKVWSQELFPTLIRSSSQGITIFITRTLTAAFAFITPAIALANPTALMGLLVVLNAAAGIVGLFWVARLPKIAQEEDAEGPLTAH
jgi:inositol transporter-like SP family MFS transporter